MNKYAYKIEKWRKENNVIQQDFANKLDITQSYLSRIESGMTPIFDIAKKISNEMNMPISEVFEKYQL